MEINPKAEVEHWAQLDQPHASVDGAEKTMAVLLIAATLICVALFMLG